MSVFHRMLSIVGIPRQSAPSVETGGCATIQVAHQTTGEIADGVCSVQIYGFASATLEGCDQVTLYAEGDRTKGIAIASNDQRYRPRGMLPGSVVVYDNSGTRVTLDGKGGITIAPTSQLVIIEGGLQTTGNVVVGTGATGSFTTPTGLTVTVRDGIITNIF